MKIRFFLSMKGYLLIFLLAVAFQIAVNFNIAPVLFKVLLIPLLLYLGLVGLYIVLKSFKVLFK